MRPTQLKVEMARQGLTGHGLARYLGFSAKAGYINKIARGDMTCNTLMAHRIAKLLGVAEGDLFVTSGIYGYRTQWVARPAENRNGVSGVED